MRNLKNLYVILILISIASCRQVENLSKRELCVTSNKGSFICNDQRKSDSDQDYELPYTPGFICLQPMEFKDLIDEYQTLREKYLMLKRRK